MSKQNGGRARADRAQKKKVSRRMRVQELRNALAAAKKEVVTPEPVVETARPH